VSADTDTNGQWNRWLGRRKWIGGGPEGNPSLGFETKMQVSLRIHLGDGMRAETKYRIRSSFEASGLA
jgi:hypothetical protein